MTSPLGFKARVGSALFAMFAEANVMYIPQDSPLVLHLPTSWRPARSRSLPHMHVQRWDLAQIRTCNRTNRRRTRYHCASDPALVDSWVLFNESFDQEPIPTSVYACSACGEVTAAMVVIKRLARVAPKVGLGRCTLHPPSQKSLALALKTREEITRIPKQDYQWPQNRIHVCVCRKHLTDIYKVHLLAH